MQDFPFFCVLYCIDLFRGGMDMKNALCLLLALLLTAGLSACDSGWGEPDHISECAEKPVIYLYPEEETEITVALDFTGDLTCTYPAYENGWTVTAAPDGTLTDGDGREYNYLFWEGISDAQYDLSQGFVVSGEDTERFLEEKLSLLGLTDQEAGDFITYWLPRMQENPYNLISFQTEAYTQTAALTISPEPDSLIRVFMVFQSLDAPIRIPEQNLISPVRTGFAVVEWGGIEYAR